VPKILILEDDAKLAESVAAGLAKEHTVEWVVDGDDALDRLCHYHFDIAILDWAVPGISGVDVCRQYRNAGGSIPILMLTGKQDLANKEEAFGIGADDYLTKPFSFRELALRVTALLRRPPIIQEQVITAGEAVLHLDNKTVTISGAELNIKPAEFALLELFLKAPSRVFTSNELLNKLYPSDTEATDEAIRQRVFRLRKLLEGTNMTVKTLPTQGYKLEILDS
jgi:DNA-binding response OmpR family regulator